MMKPLRGHFNNQEHQYGFKSNATDDDAVVEHSFRPFPSKHVHGQRGGNSEKRHKYIFIFKMVYNDIWRCKGKALSVVK